MKIMSESTGSCCSDVITWTFAHMHTHPPHTHTHAHTQTETHTHTYVTRHKPQSVDLLSANITLIKFTFITVYNLVLILRY